MIDKTSQRIRVFTYLSLGVLSVPFVFPFIWLLFASFKPHREIFSPSLFPDVWQPSNFTEIFEFQPFHRQLFNSVYIAVAVTLLTLALATFAGYALARLRFRGRNVIVVMLLAVLLMPPEVTIIPNFALVTQLNWLDTHIPLIVLPTFGASGVFGVFLMRQFFLGFPKDLEEAGLLDGLSRFGIILRIAVPLARPILGGLAVITFLASWNLFLEPLIFLDSRELFTVPVALAAFTDAYGAPVWHLQLAATALSVAPMIGVYLMAERQINDVLGEAGFMT